MAFSRRIAIQAVTTTTATFGAAVPAGQVGKLKQVKITQAGSGDAKVITLSIGTPASATNTIGVYNLVAGVNNILEFPAITLVAAEQLSVIQTGGTTGQASIEASVDFDLIA